MGGVLPGLLPVGKSLPNESRLGVVMSKEFGMGLRDFCKLFCQHLSNLVVILLPRALE